MDTQFYDDIDFKNLVELIDDPLITEIQYNGKEVWIKHQLEGDVMVPNIANSDDIMRIAKQCANKERTYFNDLHPILDADIILKLKGTLRINAVHPVLSKEITMTIRKVTTEMILSKDQLIKQGYMPEKVHDLLRLLTISGANILVSGPAGVGKTELIKYLTMFIDDKKKIITIEDARELNLSYLYPERNIETLETIPGIGYKELIKSSLRHSPEYIIIAEMRGDEVEDVINSILSGHKLLSTIHAKSAQLIPDRMLGMMHYEGKDEKDSKKLLHMVVDIGIHLEMHHLQRKILEVVEYTFDKKGNPMIQVLYKENEDLDHKSQCDYQKLSTKNISRYIQEDVYQELNLLGWID